MEIVKMISVSNYGIKIMQTESNNFCIYNNQGKLIYGNLTPLLLSKYVRAIIEKKNASINNEAVNYE